MRKVLQGVRENPVVLADGTEISITISMGAIWLPVLRHHPFAIAFDKSILLADKALYDAKANGRDHGRLVVARDAAEAPDGRFPSNLDEFYGSPAWCRVEVV
jgi:PleD family two-component response regulator